MLIDKDTSFLHETLQVAARVFRQLFGEKLIQTQPLLLFAYGKGICVHCLSLSLCIPNIRSKSSSL